MLMNVPIPGPRAATAGALGSRRSDSMRALEAAVEVRRRLDSRDYGIAVRHVGCSHRARRTAHIPPDAAALRRLLPQKGSRLRMRRACFGNRDNPSATRSPRNDSRNGTRPRGPGSRILMCALSRKGPATHVIKSPGLPLWMSMASRGFYYVKALCQAVAMVRPTPMPAR